MRHRSARALVLVVILMAACAKAPPTLSPQGVAAFNALRVVRVLDLVRDTAIDAHAQTLLSTATTRQVVTFHEAALKTIRAVPDGWKPTVLAALAELQAQVPAAEWARLALYVTVLKSVIAEV